MNQRDINAARAMAARAMAARAEGREADAVALTEEAARILIEAAQREALFEEGWEERRAWRMAVNKRKIASSNSWANFRAKLAQRKGKKNET